MSDAPKRPNPIEDVRKGLGLLFRAARTTVEKLPTTKLEDAVISGAREVGRAMENVAQTIEKEVTKRTGIDVAPKAAKSDAPKAESGDASGKPASEPPKAESEPPKSQL